MADSARFGRHHSLGLRNGVYALIGSLVLVALFWMTWKSQFAAPAGYVFETPTQAIEAGYCLTVVRQVAPGGSFGGYLDEARGFWLQRLRDFGGDLAGNIAQSEALLGRHLAAFPGPDRVWLMDAMDACSNRALIYGVRFRAFE
ncbi:hypothetical protein [uncultured Thioclava sp.]|uniref:Uncharacterized protein n=1 Tax=Thioclava arctica TaxID=3238301 RepID=A0ABV3TGH1_9RHOB|nr:hypothetical protein [uncultured Thioclava sp.]